MRCAPVACAAEFIYFYETARDKDKRTEVGDAAPLGNDVFGRVGHLGGEAVPARALPPGLRDPATGDLKQGARGALVVFSQRE